MAAVRVSLTDTALSNLFELYEDDPAWFEVLARLVSRKHRPMYGSLTMKFVDGRITIIEEQKTHKPEKVR